MSVIAAATIGSSIIGGISSNKASKRNAKSADKATAAQSQIGMAQLAESQRQFNIQEGRAVRTDALTERVTGKQLEQMDINIGLARDYDQYNKDVYRPLEKGLVAEANLAGSAAEQEALAGRAGAAVRNNFAQAQEASGRNLARMGISANSGRALAVNANLDNNMALSEAIAENGGREQAKQLGFAKRMDAASLGRNLPSAQATSAQIANSNGNSAVGNMVGANGSFNAGVSSAAGLMNNAGSTFSNVAAGYRANSTMGNNGFGDLAAGAAGMALRYGANSTGPIRQGLFSLNSTDRLVNPRADTFNQIAANYDP